MKNYLILESGNNYYLCSFSRKQILTLHPELHQMTLEKFNGVAKATIKNRKFYKKKLDFLKENGFFNEINPEFSFTERYTKDFIVRNFANCTQLTFEVTDICNLKCVYCAYGDLYNNFDYGKNKMMDFKMAKSIIDYLLPLWNSPQNVSHNVPISISFYGGEPLINFELIRQVVHYTKKLKLNHNYFKYSMTSNALLIDRHIDFLVESDFNILISLDGNEENNAYRKTTSGESSFFQVFNNIKLIQKKYPDFFEKNISFNAVLHSKNSFSDIYNFFKKEFDKNAQVSELSYVGVKEEKMEDFSKTYKNKRESLIHAPDYTAIIKDMIMDAPESQSLKNYLFANSGYVFNNLYDFLLENKDKKYLPTGTCLLFDRKLFICVDGKVLPCERIGQNYDFGHVTASGVDIDYKKIAEFVNSKINCLMKQCVNCFHIDYCPTCVFCAENVFIKHCENLTNKQAYTDNFAKSLGHLEKNKFLYRKIMEEISYE